MVTGAGGIILQGPTMSDRRVVLLIVALIAGAGLCLVVCCGGIMHFGMGVQAEEIRSELEANAKFIEHVGQVEEFSVNYMASFSDQDNEVFIYDVKGTKWSGRVTVKHETGADGKEKVIWAKFILPSGENIEL
jgi:hypothetical protein